MYEGRASYGMGMWRGRAEERDSERRVTVDATQLSTLPGPPTSRARQKAKRGRPGCNQSPPQSPPHSYLLSTACYPSPRRARVRSVLGHCSALAAAMALQAPSLMRAPAPQRSAPPRPSFSAPWSLRLPAPARRRVATAPRITMRVASKQAYICRDCGWVSHSHPSGRGAALYFARARRAAALACRAVARPARMHAAVPVLVPDLLPLSVRFLLQVHLQRQDAVRQAG